MTTGNDFAFTANGRLQLETDEVIAAAIKLKHRLAFVLGEWFLDQRLGVPYFDVVFVKNPDIEVIRRMFRRIILSCPPIADVKSLDVYFLKAERKLVYEFQAVAEDGRTITGGSGNEFIVGVDGTGGA